MQANCRNTLPKLLHIASRRRSQGGRIHTRAAQTIAPAASVGLRPLCSAYILDLSPVDTAELNSQAPEFNRYARLVVSNGTFTFRYVNASTQTPAIKANADFRYWGWGVASQSIRIPMPFFEKSVI